ncbi:uncharacterized protein LOC126982378 [Eriocheir sinensis]|uniref:uncharacterized protein LOC126982378 n=1 Tax=Eriocheir sinensis TaxID=95602 RepID=UPI0021C5976A|nr:uncharacterized protein LOC126982378 [Eriocheir sinensis]XP_050690353.1 uncharacterized protein LOC126982378 [Eriocheir sinensis]
MTASLLMVIIMVAAVEATAVAEAANRWTLPLSSWAGRRADGECDTEGGVLEIGQSLYLDECRKLVCKSIVGQPIVEEHFCETLPRDLPPSCVVSDGRGTRHPDCCARVVCSPADETFEFETTMTFPGNSKHYPGNSKSPQRIIDSLTRDMEYLSGNSRDSVPPRLTDPSMKRIPESIAHVPVYRRDPLFPENKVPLRNMVRRPHVANGVIGKYSVPVRRPGLPVRRPAYPSLTPHPLRMPLGVTFGQGHSHPHAPPPTTHVRPLRLPSHRPILSPELHSGRAEGLAIQLDPPNNIIPPPDITDGSLYYDDENEALPKDEDKDFGGEIFWIAPDAFPNHKNEVNFKDEIAWKVSNPLSFEDETGNGGETSWEGPEMFPQHKGEMVFGDELSLMLPQPPKLHPSLSNNSRPSKEVSYVYYTNPREVRTSPHPYLIYPITTPMPKEPGEGAEVENPIFLTNSIIPDREEHDNPWIPVSGVTVTSSPTATATPTPTRTKTRPSLRRPSFPRTRGPFIKTPRPSPLPSTRHTTLQPHVTTWRPSTRLPVITTTPSTLSTTLDNPNTPSETSTSTTTSYEFATAKLNPNEHDIHEFFHTPLDPSELIPGHDAFMKSKQEAQKEYQSSNSNTTTANKTRRSLSPSTLSRNTSGVKHRPVFYIPWRRNAKMVSQHSSTPIPEEEMDEVYRAETFHPIKFDADFESPKMTTEQFIVDLPSSSPSLKSLPVRFGLLKPEEKLQSFNPSKSTGKKGRQFVEERTDNAYENTPTTGLSRNDSALSFLLREEDKVNAMQGDIIALTYATKPPSITLGPQGRIIDEDNDVETQGIKTINIEEKQQSNLTVNVKAGNPSTPPAFKWSPPHLRFPGRRQYRVPRPKPDNIQMPDYGNFPEKEHLGVLFYEPIKQETKPITTTMTTPSRSDETIPGTSMTFETLDSFHHKTESRLTGGMAHKTHMQMQIKKTTNDTNPQEYHRGEVPLKTFPDNYHPSENHRATPFSLSLRKDDTRMSNVYYYSEEALSDEIDFEVPQYFGYITDETKASSEIPKQFHSHSTPDGVLHQGIPQLPHFHIKGPNEPEPPSSRTPTGREALKPNGSSLEKNERHDVSHGLTEDLQPNPLYTMTDENKIVGEQKPLYHRAQADTLTLSSQEEMRDHLNSQRKNEKEERKEEEDKEEDEEEKKTGHYMRPRVIISRASHFAPLQPLLQSSSTAFTTTIATTTRRDDFFFNNKSITLPPKSNYSSLNQTPTLPPHTTSPSRTLRRRPETRYSSTARFRDAPRTTTFSKPQEFRESLTVNRSRNRLLPTVNKQHRLPPPNQRRLSSRQARIRLRVSRLATGTRKESTEGTKELLDPSESSYETKNLPNNQPTSIETVPIIHISQDPKPDTKKPTGSTEGQTESPKVTVNSPYLEITPQVTKAPMKPYHENVKGHFTHESRSVPHQSASLNSQGQTIKLQDQSTDRQTYSHNRPMHESSRGIRDEWEPIKTKMSKG